MTAFEQDVNQDELPTWENLKKMSKEEIQALVSSSRAALESVVSMPEAAKSERYNAIVSDRLAQVETACRDAERLLVDAPPPPEVDVDRLQEAAEEAPRLLGDDLLAQDDEAWRETLARLRQIGKEMAAAEKAMATQRAEVGKIQDAFRPATGIDRDIRSQSEMAMHSMLREAGVDWRLMSKVRSKPAVDSDFYNEFRRAQVSFATETPMDSENAVRYASLKEAAAALDSRIQDLRHKGQPPEALEALRQRAILEGTLSKVLMLVRRPADAIESEVDQRGPESLAKKTEKFREEREAAETRRRELKDAFLGTLRHRTEIAALDWKVADLDAKISKNTQVVESFSQEAKRKERASEVMAALRGVDLG